MKEEDVRELTRAITEAFQQLVEQPNMTIPSTTSRVGRMNRVPTARGGGSCTRLSWAASWLGLLAARMGISKELQRQGYEFKHDLSNPDKRCEVWVSPKAGRGVLIQWFTLTEEVKA